MNSEILGSLITRYLNVSQTDPNLAEQHAEHQRRIERAKLLLTEEHIPDLKREEWVEILRDTDAARGNPWDTRTFWTRHYPEGAELSVLLKESLLRLIRDASRELTAHDFNAALASLPHIGTAYLSELLAIRFPDRYWMLNRVVRAFLGMVGVDLKAELPRGKKGDDGEHYMLAGKYLREVRAMLEKRAGVGRGLLDDPVKLDFMDTDLFIWWAIEQDERDVWRGKIVGIIREEMPEERIAMRTNGEARARSIAQDALAEDRYSGEMVHRILSHLNMDVVNGKSRGDRFMPALYGHLANLIAADPDTFFRWFRVLWESEDHDLDEILDYFWRREEIPGAGISLPTAILYLRDPTRYAIWLPVMEEGLSIATNFTPGKRRTADGYRRYNSAAQRFREQYGLVPQALDSILWRIAKDTVPDVIELNGTGGGIQLPWEGIDRYSFEDLCASTYLDERFWTTCKALMTDKRQIILYGPPGTGKTFVAQEFAKHWMHLADDPRGEMRVVQFHPSYAYEEFVEGIRPRSVERPGGGSDLSYEVRPGVFRAFCEEAARNPGRCYVMILDEINRGEIARIFGELLYLLEYRSKKVLLPYSGIEFSVPNNLFVIGTMNSADRSIAMVDHALRRRFHFVPMHPSPEALRAFHERQGNTAMARTADLLELANSQLSRDGIEWHLHIGHSHMMSPELDETRLRMIWEHSIFPTLEEYFYRQLERIQAYKLDALLAELGGI